MQESKGLVSIIIPAYNAAVFIQETLDSILAQTYKNFEIIIIDDGSKDNTEGVVKQYTDKRISYKVKENEGVSIARNYGFPFSKGQYIVFFDHDDLMPIDFLEKRVEVLDDNDGIGFCCGKLEFFPKYKEQYGACEDIPREILLYYQHIETCPSNYLFRRNLVEKVKFHPNLAIAADRFFLLQIAQLSKGKRIEEAKLKYRFESTNFSAQLTPRYVEDNELYYTLLETHKLIPKQIANLAKQKGNYILGAMNFKISRPYQAFKYVVKWCWFSFKVTTSPSFASERVLIETYINHNNN
jgi:glycosyltransferase involved in cell wall biosynthesis